MWLLDHGGRRIARLALAAGFSMALAGCFQPMYAARTTATGETSSPVVANLASVEVLPIDGRVGQQIRNELIFSLTGGSGAAPIQYRLSTNVRHVPRSAIVDAVSDRPLLETMSVDASYVLVQVGTGQPVLSGSAFGRATYTTTRQRYANLRAERDAEDRAAKVVSDQIYARLAAYFASGR